MRRRRRSREDGSSSGFGSIPGVLVFVEAKLKHSERVSELQQQVVQLQEELKKVREERSRALEELAEAKKSPINEKEEADEMQGPTNSATGQMAIRSKEGGTVILSGPWWTTCYICAKSKF